MEVSHRGDLFNGVFVLVELAGFFIQHTICVEAEMLDHERVHRLALDILVAVFFIGEVGVLRLGLCVVVFVDRPDERVLNLRRVFCPVATHGNELERARRGQGGKLGVVRLQLGRLVDRQAAFTIAATEEMSRHHHHRHTDRHAFIDRRQQKCLRAAARTPSDSDALGVHLR